MRFRSVVPGVFLVRIVDQEENHISAMNSVCARGIGIGTQQQIEGAKKQAGELQVQDPGSRCVFRLHW